MFYDVNIACYQITLFDLIHMISMVDHVVIGVKASMINSRCSLEKEFTKFICVNP